MPSQKSTSLSISDVHETIGRLEASVVAGISGLYRQFAVMNIGAVDFQEDILTVLDMIHTLKKVSAKGQYLNEIAVFQSKIDLLTLLDKIHRELQGFEMMMETKELSGAALAISDAKALIDELAELHNAQGFTLDIYVALKRDMLAKKAHLKHIFDELYRTAFFYSCENDISELVITFRITVTASAKYHDSPVFLISLIQSMNSAGLLTDYLTIFAESFIKNFIDRIIKNAASELSMSKTKLNATIRFGNVKGMISNVPHSKPDAFKIFDQIFKITHYLRECLLGAEETTEWTPENQLFVNILFPLLMDTLRTNLLIPSIPDNRDAMNTYPEFLNELRRFDERLKADRLCFPENMELDMFAGNARLQCARKRRAFMMIGIREIIESEDQNTYEVEEATERGSIKSLYSAKMGMAGNKTISESAPGKTTKTGLEMNDISFRLPKCHVSVQAQTLVEQAYQILTEASTMDPETATELFYCARDIFDMYRAVMPVLHEDELLNSPTRAVLFYNDTEYICHHLLTMGYQFQDRLPPAINQFATFLDMVPFFRNMGESYFRAQMRKQRDIVQMHVSNAQGFSNLTDDARFETVERCIKQALSHLNSLSRVWKPILAEEMYLNTMGLLVDTFLESIMTQVSALAGTLRVEEGHQLRYILGLVLKAEDMFEKRVPGGSGGSSSSGMRGIGKKAAGWVKMPVRKYVNRWDAFLKVKEDLIL
ncbi:Centromere/kinetochore protein zw10 [Chytriomyces hyalinus]|nr:Centromere/kinetochore protein zw10 [Chytriomyces hyalinus]